MEVKFLKILKKYLKIYARFFRFNLIFSMTYRTSFMLELGIEILYTITAILFFNVVYGNIKELAGWSYYEVMFLIGIDVIMSEMFVGLVFALNTNNVPESIKNGAIDTVLLKPISSQFALTIARPYIASLITMIPGFYLMWVSVTNLHIHLHILNVVMGLLVLVCGFIIGYSIMTIMTSLAFYFTNAKFFPRIGMNIVMYFQARPHTIFNNLVLKTIFFFIVPVVFVASIPASTIVKGIEWPLVVMAILVAAVFLSLSIIIWKKMILYYSSATS